MCFGGKGNTTPPSPQQPTTFQPLSSNQTDVQRQAASMNEKGYTNTATYGSELSSGGQAQATTPATTGGM